MSNYNNLKIVELKDRIKEKGGLKSRYTKKDDLIKYLKALEKDEKCDQNTDCSNNGKCVVEPDKDLPGLCVPDSLQLHKNQTEIYEHNGRKFYGSKKAIERLTKLLEPAPSPRGAPSLRGAPSSEDIIDIIKIFGGKNTEMINKNDLLIYINNVINENRCEHVNNKFCADKQTCDIEYSPGICVPDSVADNVSKYTSMKHFDINGGRFYGSQEAINRFRQIREDEFPDEERKYPESDEDENPILDINPFVSQNQPSSRASVRSERSKTPDENNQSSSSDTPQNQPSARSLRASVRSERSKTPDENNQSSSSDTPQIQSSDVSSILSQLEKDGISSIEDLSESNKQVLKCLGLLG